jgi:hypothetical protein
VLYINTKVDLIHLQTARLLKYRNWASYAFRGRCSLSLCQTTLNRPPSARGSSENPEDHLSHRARSSSAWTELNEM